MRSEPTDRTSSERGAVRGAYVPGGLLLLAVIILLLVVLL